MIRLLGSVLMMALLLTSSETTMTAKAEKEETVVCPVLKQKVPKSKAVKVVYKGKTYYVCCDTCAEQVRSGKVKLK